MLELTTTRGFAITVDEKTFIGDYLRERKYYEEAGTAAVCSLLRPGDVAVDAGANIGYFSLVMQSCGAKVIAIEPNRQLIGLLLGNVGGFCDVYRCALSDVDGEAPFYLPSKWESGWGSLAAADKGDRSRPVTVQTRRLDSILPEGSIRLIKMDIEGAEIPALRGLGERLKDVDYLLIECVDIPSRVPVFESSTNAIKSFLDGWKQTIVDSENILFTNPRIGG